MPQCHYIGAFFYFIYLFIYFIFIFIYLFIYLFIYFFCSHATSGYHWILCAIRHPLWLTAVFFIGRDIIGAHMPYRAYRSVQGPTFPAPKKFRHRQSNNTMISVEAATQRQWGAEAMWLIYVTEEEGSDCYVHWCSSLCLASFLKADVLNASTSMATITEHEVVYAAGEKKIYHLGPVYGSLIYLFTDCPRLSIPG